MLAGIIPVASALTGLVGAARNLFRPAPVAPEKAFACCLNQAAAPMGNIPAAAPVRLSSADLAQMTPAEQRAAMEPLTGRTVEIHDLQGRIHRGKLEGIRFEKSGATLQVDGHDIAAQNIQFLLTADSNSTTGKTS